LHYKYIAFFQVMALECIVYCTAFDRSEDVIF
jgi:hypothetical protein